ncbi:hypothetical protein [Nostoc sp. CALU 546]
MTNYSVIKANVYGAGCGKLKINLHDGFWEWLVPQDGIKNQKLKMNTA